MNYFRHVMQKIYTFSLSDECFQKPLKTTQIKESIRPIRKVRVLERTFANLRLRREYCAAADLLLSTKWQNEALSMPVSYEEFPDITFFLISKIEIQVQYCKYYSILLCDQMYAVLKHSGFPRRRCFQIENTGSQLEENTGISQITELSIVNWAIMMCTSLIFAHTFGNGTQTRRNLLRISLAAY